MKPVYDRVRRKWHGVEKCEAQLGGTVSDKAETAEESRAVNAFLDTWRDRINDTTGHLRGDLVWLYRAGQADKKKADAMVKLLSEHDDEGPL